MVRSQKGNCDDNDDDGGGGSEEILALHPSDALTLDHFGRLQNLPSVEAGKLMQGECMAQCLVQARV